MSRLLSLFTVLVSLILSFHISSAQAVPIIFDFEGLSRDSSVNSLSLTQSGLTITVTQPGTNFRLRDDALRDPSFGGISLLGGGLTARPFLVNFSEAVNSISIDGGDFSGSVNDEFDNPSLTAFDAIDAAGNQVDTDSVTGCCGGGSGFEFVTLRVAGTGIRSIQFIGGGQQFPVSLFFDNLCVDPDGSGCASAQSSQSVPEPGASALLLLGLAGIALTRRRRHANKC